MEAERWLKMCTQYDPDYIECALTLTKVYLAHSNLEKAVKSATDMITRPRTDRRFINHFKLWDCDIPLTVMRILVNKLTMAPTLVSRGEAKYILLLVRYQ